MVPVGGRSCTGNGARVEGGLPAASSQPTSRKSLLSRESAQLWGQRACERQMGLLKKPCQGGEGRHSPRASRNRKGTPAVCTPGTMQIDMGLVGQGRSQHSGKAGTYTKDDRGQ